MRTPKLTLLALALAAAFPSLAADPTPAETQKELDALKARLAETKAELDRIVVKTEAMEDARDDSGFKGFKVSGYLDVGYHYNVNKERGSFQFLVPNAADPYGYDNSFFGSVALTVEKETESGAAFKLTLVPTRSTGDFIGGANIVHEASVSIPVDAIGGRIFAGQVPDWSGYEYLPPTQNKLITHNLLFDFTLPFVYTGVGIETSAGDWTLKGMIANVNTPLRQIGENVPVFVCRGDMEGSEFWGIGFACLAGKKTNFNGGEDTLTLTAEIDGWYTRGDLTLNAQVSYGQQEKASITPDPDTGDLRDSQWIGASVLAAYKVTPRTELILRGDYIYNQENGGGLFDWTLADPINGLGPDPAGDPEKGTDRYAITAGIGYQASENVVLKAEYRYDGATKKVFGNKDAILDYVNEAPSPSPDAKLLSNNSLVSGSIVFSF